LSAVKRGRHGVLNILRRFDIKLGGLVVCKLMIDLL